MNPVLECIQDRFTCRAFTGQMPADEKLHAIMQAATQSPSAMNRQPWQVILLRNTGLLAEMDTEGMRLLSSMPDRSAYERIQSRGGKLFYNAPCAIFIAIEPGTELDCGIVSQTIALAAQSVGLGSCICGMARLAFSGEKAAYYKEKLAFPIGSEFGMAVLLGETASAGTPHEALPEKITVIG